MTSENTAESSMKDETKIQQFYKHKSIFLTGATGFLGKIIMEKLLRCCEVAKIYVLIRSKKDKSMDERCETIFDDAVFEKLKQENPKFRHKIVPLFGDCMLPGLGINKADREILKDNVNIVFHVAATVRFDEKLRLALQVNVSATRDIILLAREIPNLEALVHVSTAYANSNRFDIDEKIYKMTPTGQHMCQLAETLDEDTFDIIGPLIMRAWPNTYAYTKCLAEELVQDMGTGLPITIFRPAMVVATYKEPIAGWIDNMYGPTGIMVGVGTGLLRILFLTKENHAEVVPVDMCVNSLLASAWDVAVSSPYPTPPVYNYVASTQNPLSWQRYIELGLAQGDALPILQAIWHYCFTTTSNRYVACVLTFFYHTVPATLIDGGLMMIGKKPRMLKMYKKIHKFCQLIGYFTTQQWTFTNDNVQNLWRKLDTNDQKLFFFNMSDVDWPLAIRGGVYGMRRYLLKEDPATLPQAIVRAKRLKVIHYITLYTIYAIGLIIFYYILKSCCA